LFWLSRLHFYTLICHYLGTTTIVKDKSAGIASPDLSAPFF
jgi:hypothetical protein